MKSLLLVLMLALTTPAFAGNFVEDASQCTFFATKATEYSVLARSLKESDLPDYMTYIQADVDALHTQAAKETITHIAEIAWNAHAMVSPSVVGMAIYNECMKSKETST